MASKDLGAGEKIAGLGAAIMLIGMLVLGLLLPWWYSSGAGLAFGNVENDASVSLGAWSGLGIFGWVANGFMLLAILASVDKIVCKLGGICEKFFPIMNLVLAGSGLAATVFVVLRIFISSGFESSPKVGIFVTLLGSLLVLAGGVKCLLGQSERSVGSGGGLPSTPSMTGP